MQYRLGDTFIDVLLDEEMDGTEFIWVCTVYVGNSLLMRVVAPRSAHETKSDAEFSFLRIIAWELSNTVTNLLWGGEKETQNDVITKAYYGQKD